MESLNIEPRISGRLEEALLKFSKPSYYKQLENGGFDTEEYGDALEMEEDPDPNLNIESGTSKQPETSIVSWEKSVENKAGMVIGNEGPATSFQRQF